MNFRQWTSRWSRTLRAAGSPPPVRLATCIRHPALTRIEQRVAAYRIYL